jgi:hypothetical protein
MVRTARLACTLGGVPVCVDVRHSVGRRLLPRVESLHSDSEWRDSNFSIKASAAASRLSVGSSAYMTSARPSIQAFVCSCVCHRSFRRSLSFYTCRTWNSDIKRRVAGHTSLHVMRIADQPGEVASASRRCAQSMDSVRKADQSPSHDI